ncbi:hypothetical protein HS7_05980 [Sulfolobales archaeon HS-7]|nr:hypothetical protein HS7_05980 [Sulfolobales archaeon HS-7]
MGAGIAGLLLGSRLFSDVILFDRRRVFGKKCTGIISRHTFERLGVSKEYIDAPFDTIKISVGKDSVFIKTNIIRLNREKLERDLAENLKVLHPTSVNLINEHCVGTNVESFCGKVILATGWQGRARWVKAIEEEKEPINEDFISVFLDKRNPAGFSWIVPLGDRTLVGAISYSDPRLFVPHIDKRRIGIHGGIIPRVKPKKVTLGYIGDSTGLIKTFTGGGIFSIARLLEPVQNWLVYDKDYSSELKLLSKEVSRQYLMTSILEKTWDISLKSIKLLKDRTFHINNEFDLHSLLFKRLFSN